MLTSYGWLMDTIWGSTNYRIVSMSQQVLLITTSLRGSLLRSLRIEIFCVRTKPRRSIWESLREEESSYCLPSSISACPGPCHSLLGLSGVAWSTLGYRPQTTGPALLMGYDWAADGQSEKIARAGIKEPPQRWV